METPGGVLPSRLSIERMSDAAVARSLALRFAQRVGFRRAAAHEVAIIAGELASNLVRHASAGVLELEWRDGAVVLRSFDQERCEEVPAALLAAGGEKPRIVDDSGQMQAGLGCGFGAIRRLSDAVTVRRREDGRLEITASLRDHG